MVMFAANPSSPSASFCIHRSSLILHRSARPRLCASIRHFALFILHFALPASAFHWQLATNNQQLRNAMLGVSLGSFGGAFGVGLGALWGCFWVGLGCFRIAFSDPSPAHRVHNCFQVNILHPLWSARPRRIAPFFMLPRRPTLRPIPPPRQAADARSIGALADGQQDPGASSAVERAAKE